MKGDVELVLKGVGDQAVAKEVKHILEMVLALFCLSFEVYLCFSLILLWGFVVGETRNIKKRSSSHRFSHTTCC